MNKLLPALSGAVSAVPALLALGALLLFAAGYFAHSLWGDNSAIEEISEELLKKEYNIQVEFSNQDNKGN
jgi:hypothetical protein